MKSVSALTFIDPVIIWLTSALKMQQLCRLTFGTWGLIFIRSEHTERGRAAFPR